MGKAVRAIIVQDNKLLVMFRNKNGHKYYTLVGGQVEPDEPLEKSLIREIKEETGLTVTAASQVFYEKHESPYNEQYIYLCNTSENNQVKIQEFSEEAMLNRLGMNIHEPLWVTLQAFEKLAFRTPQLREAIIRGLKEGFPKKPLQIN